MTTFTGWVDEVGTDTFWATLVDENLDEHAAEIEMSAVLPDDRPLVQVGALFDWHIVEGDDTGGIVFRRDVWTAEELERAEKGAVRLVELFE